MRRSLVPSGMNFAFLIVIGAALSTHAIAAQTDAPVMDGDHRLSYTLAEAPQELTPYAVTYVGDWIPLMNASMRPYSRNDTDNRISDFNYKLSTGLWLTDKTVSRLGKTMLVGYTTTFQFRSAYFGQVISSANGGFEPPSTEKSLVT